MSKKEVLDVEAEEVMVDEVVSQEKEMSDLDKVNQAVMKAINESAEKEGKIAALDLDSEAMCITHLEIDGLNTLVLAPLDEDTSKPVWERVSGQPEILAIKDKRTVKILSTWLNVIYNRMSEKELEAMPIRDVV